MTHTNSSDHARILSGLFLVALGVFAGQVVCVTDPTLQAMILPASKMPVSRVVRPLPKSSSSSSRKAVVRESARSIRLHGAAPDGPRVIAAPAYQKPYCGDKLVLLDEKCDDGNAKGGDGCSAACQVEPGFACNAGQPSSCWSSCGDGIVASNERCDDGNTRNDDGCSATCKVDLNYTCTGAPSTCYITPICGDHLVEHGETCDDGNVTAGDGCSAACQTE
jgi:cysteine-rich repeat protein